MVVKLVPGEENIKEQVPPIAEGFFCKSVCPRYNPSRKTCYTTCPKEQAIPTCTSSLSPTVEAHWGYGKITSWRRTGRVPSSSRTAAPWIFVLPFLGNLAILLKKIQSTTGLSLSLKRNVVYLCIKGYLLLPFKSSNPHQQEVYYDGGLHTCRSPNGEHNQDDNQ